MPYFPTGYFPTGATNAGTPASDQELLSLQRGTKTDDGKGSKVTTWQTVQSNLIGKVRCYRDRGSRERLETAPGVQTKTEYLVFFEETFVTLDVRINDRLTRTNGDILRVNHVRKYPTSLQLDTEIVQ